MTSLRNWIDSRIGLDDLIKTGLKDFRVPAGFSIYYTLGFVALTAYVVQMITGVFLLIYYIPHPVHAFGSVNDIMAKVPYGWLFRQMHQAGGSLMTAVLMLHILFVFLNGVYKRPREMTWITGSVMLFTVLAFCLTGYLLPWNQLGYWTTTLLIAMITNLPFLGEPVAQILRGGSHLSEISLSRFFALHVALLPVVFITFMIIHLFLIRRTGFSAMTSSRSAACDNAAAYRRDDHPDGHPFYPYYIVRAMFMAALYLSVLFFIISLYPAIFLNEYAITPADPLKTPAMIRPAWYFLAPYQMLKLIPIKELGAAIEFLLLSAFFAWPFLDRHPERNVFRRPFLRVVFIVFCIFWLLFTVWGKY